MENSSTPHNFMRGTIFPRLIILPDVIDSSVRVPKKHAPLPGPQVDLEDSKSGTLRHEKGVVVVSKLNT